MGVEFDTEDMRCDVLPIPFLDEAVNDLEKREVHKQALISRLYVLSAPLEAIEVERLVHRRDLAGASEADDLEREIVEHADRLRKFNLRCRRCNNIG